MSSQADISEDDLVLRLQGMGYSRVDAEKLNAFVPSAFSWPLLKKMGAVSLPNHFLATDANGADVEFPIADQHYFTAALALSYSLFEHGWTEAVPRRTHEIVTGRSAEMDALDKVHANGGSVKGASVGAFHLLRISAEEVRGV